MAILVYAFNIILLFILQFFSPQQREVKVTILCGPRLSRVTGHAERFLVMATTPTDKRGKRKASGDEVATETAAERFAISWPLVENRMLACWLVVLLHCTALLCSQGPTLQKVQQKLRVPP